MCVYGRSASAVSADTRRIGELYLRLLPIATVCAPSPWAIVAVILMLASDRPANSVAWLVDRTLSTVAQDAACASVQECSVKR